MSGSTVFKAGDLVRCGPEGYQACVLVDDQASGMVKVQRPPDEFRPSVAWLPAYMVRPVGGEPDASRQVGYFGKPDLSASVVVPGIARPPRPPGCNTTPDAAAFASLFDADPLAWWECGPVREADSTTDPDTTTRAFATGAVRSADGDHFSFTTMPWLGILGVARTSYEGMVKYGGNNYRLGIPAHVSLDRAFRHMIMHVLGDRSEPHLSHAQWNLAAAQESYLLHPELNEPHTLGPGVTVTPAMRDYLEAGKAERDAKREKGLFAKLGDWCLAGLPEVKRLLGQRRAVQAGEKVGS